ncbi:MAG TPA: UvrB/UvrC motif-containing protein [Tepidisphaeraceae bacterium]|nr:UvrB/UvrC motif-containing protein [Tepidisphaeraceae bacterium]
MIFDGEISFDPAGDFAAILAGVPAKWVVYLMSDGNGLPVQLLCVKNLRASLQRRLGENEQIGPSKRIGYRELVRKIAWRRVDSAFEADCVYLDAAREIFPQTYRGMLAFKETWFLHVSAADRFPRYVKTNNPTNSAGDFLGPIKDKDAAGRLIELVEDAFDLCRYYNILVEAPNGRACAYKEMGKCPAPCDGTISMDEYRAAIARSIDVLRNPAPYLAEQNQQMQRASADLNFERAAKIKSHIERINRLHAGQYSLLRSISDFSFVSLQRGPRAKCAKLFLITPTMIDEPLCICYSPNNWAEIFNFLSHRKNSASSSALDQAAAERLAIVASHLFMPKKQGVFLAWSDVNEATLARAYRQLGKQKESPDSVDEGMVKDLQSL